uniref:Uncharacterized protein At2g29840 n=1 Tax=Arabidopsis thaliana TaxID=3702 RepID=O82372_ARATH|nr:hypothetical protein [Arabidopsis thaliana]
MRGDSKQEGDEESKLTVSCANDVEGIRVRKRGDSREEEAKGFKSLNWNWDFQKLYRFVDELTSSDDYTPACALRVSMTLTTVIPPEQTEEAAPSDHAEEVDQVSLNEDLGLEVENDANFFYGESSSSQPGRGVPFYELPHLRYEHDVNFSYGEASSSQLGGFVPFHGLPYLGYEQDPNVFYGQSSPYQPQEVLFHWLPRYEHDFDHQTEEAFHPQFEQVLQASFNETNTARLKPASKLAVESLNRKTYKKASDVVGENEMCSICLEEFDDGRSIVALPCGHEFDDECALKWFETNHDCPLCRFKLPCEDQ